MISPGQLTTRLTVKDLSAARVQALELPDVLVLSVDGRVNYKNAPELRDAIFSALQTPKSARLVIELGSVESMDTSGAAVLVEAVGAGPRNRKEVLLCTPSESVLKMFRLAGLYDVLECCCSTPEETWERVQVPVGR